MVSNLRVEFGQGLNVLTGETGSGKSIIVDALGLLLGHRRTEQDLIREGAESAVVEGTFEIGEDLRAQVTDALKGIGVDLDVDEDLIVRRELRIGGRHRAYLNDQSVTATTIKGLQPLLLEIHGQFEQQGLLSAAQQLEMLDQFGRCGRLRREVGEIYGELTNLQKEREELAREMAEREQTMDVLKFQLAELHRIDPLEGEDDDLMRERQLLTHGEKIAQLSDKAYQKLYENDASVLGELASVRRNLEELCVIDVELRPILTTIDEAAVMLRDASESILAYRSGSEQSPDRLAEVEDRLATLERLKRKYNSSLATIRERRGEMVERLGRLEESGDRERSLGERWSKVRAKYDEKARELSACRRHAIPALERGLIGELSQVAMEQAQFLIKVVDLSASDNVKIFQGSPSGNDEIEFLLSANPGEPLRPLARIASGGELSRLMLTLRVAKDSRAAKEHDVSQETIVFDEIDAGIGGRVAEAVGRRLKGLASPRRRQQRQQLLCVTHQPQIARFADHHFYVSKSVIDGRTVTDVRELNEEERIGELARMIGGAEDQAQSTRGAARWLIESARASGEVGADQTADGNAAGQDEVIVDQVEPRAARQPRRQPTTNTRRRRGQGA